MDAINAELEAQGYKIRDGEISIIDATVIEAQRCRKRQAADGEDSRDAEASYSVKKAANGKKTATYGFKAHTNVDEDGFVMKLTYTTGSVHDSQEFERLLTYDEQVVYADKAYDSKEHRQLLERCGIESKVQRRATRGYTLTPAQVSANKRYGIVRSRVVKWSSLCAQKNKGLWQKFGVSPLAGCSAVVTGSCLDIPKNVKTATPQQLLKAQTDPTIMLRRGT